MLRGCSPTSVSGFSHDKSRLLLCKRTNTIIDVPWHPKRRCRKIFLPGNLRCAVPVIALSSCMVLFCSIYRSILAIDLESNRRTEIHCSKVADQPSGFWNFYTLRHLWNESIYVYGDVDERNQTNPEIIRSVWLGRWHVTRSVTLSHMAVMNSASLRFQGNIKAGSKTGTLDPLLP